MLLHLLLACTDEGPSIAVCEAAMGLHVDTESLVLLRELLADAEVKALEGSEPTAGSEAVDRTALRQRTQCVGVLQGGEVALTRWAPEVQADGSLGDDVQTTFAWTQEDDRVTTGLLQALAQRAAIPPDPIEAEAAWEALAASYADSTLAVDVARARELADKARYLAGKVELRFDVDVETGRLMGHVRNRGEQALLDATFVATFGERAPLTFSRARLEPGTAVTMVEMAPGAVTLSGVDLVSWELEPPTP